MISSDGFNAHLICFLATLDQHAHFCTCVAYKSLIFIYIFFSLVSYVRLILFYFCPSCVFTLFLYHLKLFSCCDKTDFPGWGSVFIVSYLLFQIKIICSGFGSGPSPWQELGQTWRSLPGLPIRTSDNIFIGHSLDLCVGGYQTLRTDIILTTCHV